MSAADALFPAVLQRVLAQLFVEAQEPVHVSELIRRVGSGSGAVHRILKRLDACGLVSVKASGNQKLYQANHDHPVFEDLKGLIRKTSGLAGPLRDALSPLSDRIDEAFVFGSIARGDETPASDVDLMILSDRLSYSDVFEVLPQAEAELGRAVNPHLESPKEWSEKIAVGHAFAEAVNDGAKIAVVSSRDGES